MSKHHTSSIDQGKHHTSSIDQGMRLLKDDELDNVSGGYYGCIFHGGIWRPQGPNPYLTPGSPERGGNVWQQPT
jgi:hypothetical protein